MKIANNPIDMAIEVMEENYPKVASRIKTIEFAYITKQFSATVFDGDDIYIFLNATMEQGRDLTIERAALLLVHEFAHAVAGNHAHGQLWENVVERLLYLIHEKKEEER